MKKKLDAYTIVCGMPRSGTRQFTDFLNRNETCCIQAEIDKNIVKNIHELVISADTVYRKTQKKHYFLKRQSILINLFAMFSKGRILKRPSARIHGFKTPNIELMHPELLELILPTTDNIKFFYCIRNIKDCLLSHLSMPWFLQKPQMYIDRYLQSLKTAIQIQDEVAQSNPGVEIHILNLDSFIASDNKAEWLSTRMFAPLNIELSSHEAENYVNETKNRNATVRVTGKEKAKTLSVEIEALFEKNKVKINHGINNFNNKFNSNLALI